MRRVRAGVPTVLALATALLCGCGAVLPGTPSAARVSADDLVLIRSYIAALNAAGEAGSGAQADYLRATQDPDTPPTPLGCLGRVTLETRLVDRTLRPDPDFVAPRRDGPPARPAGAVYVAAAGVTAAQDGVTVREQVGSKHVVIRNGRVYGYSPCPG